MFDIWLNRVKRKMVHLSPLHVEECPKATFMVRFTVHPNRRRLNTTWWWLWASFKTWGAPCAGGHPCAAGGCCMGDPMSCQALGLASCRVLAGSLAPKLIIPSGFGIMLLSWVCQKSFYEQCRNRPLLVQSGWIVYAKMFPGFLLLLL